MHISISSFNFKFQFQVSISSFNFKFQFQVSVSSFSFNHIRFMFKLLLKSKFIGFVEAPVGVFCILLNRYWVHSLYYRILISRILCPNNSHCLNFAVTDRPVNRPPTDKPTPISSDLRA